METNPNEYNVGADQNQGVVGTMARNQQHGDTEAEGTEKPETDPNLVINADEKGDGNPSDELATDMLGKQEFVNDEGID